MIIAAGFPATLEIRENLENEFPVFQSGKTQGIWGKHKKSGKTKGICDSDPEGKGFRQFRVCASCAMCPSCIHWLTAYSGFCEYYTPLQTVTVGCARTTSCLPSNLIKGKVFLMEFWNFLREISGKTPGFGNPALMSPMLLVTAMHFRVKLWSFQNITIVSMYPNIYQRNVLQNDCYKN